MIGAAAPRVDAAQEIIRLSSQSDDDRVRYMASAWVYEHAWGKPKDYDPAAEKPKDRTFDPRDYPPAALALIEEALILMLPPEEREARRQFAVISPALRQEHDQQHETR